MSLGIVSPVGKRLRLFIALLDEEVPELAVRHFYRHIGQAIVVGVVLVSGEGGEGKAQEVGGERIELQVVHRLLGLRRMG